MPKEVDNKVAQLQMLEQNIQNVLMQKQGFQAQLIEIENALEEISNAKGKVYKITGPIMVSLNPEDIKKELNSKKEITELRIKSIEKQEEQLKEKASKIQNEVLSKIKGSEKDG